jgi:hypothetical protein
VLTACSDHLNSRNAYNNIFIALIVREFIHERFMSQLRPEPNLALLESNLMHWLQISDGSMSEYELLTIIEAEYPEFFKVEPPLESLYQRHFWLFHHLYLLQHQLSKKQLYLAVNALSIQVTPSTAQSNHISQPDPLKTFYLDINNLRMSEVEVNKMQDEFWQRYLAIDKKAEAIKTLGLTDDVALTKEAVKRRYKQLVHEHHPDKRGDAKHFHQIKQAYNTLMLLF